LKCLFSQRGIPPKTELSKSKNVINMFNWHKICFKDQRDEFKFKKNKKNKKLKKFILFRT